MKRVIMIAAAIVVAAGTGGALIWQSSAAASAYDTTVRAETSVNEQSTVRPYNCGINGCTQDGPHRHHTDETYGLSNTNQEHHGNHENHHSFGYGGEHH